MKNLATDAGAARTSSDVAAVADNLITLVRAFNKVRARLLAAAAHDVEWSARIILKVIEREGPLRASALAEQLQSDPSTVSRQVATLVRDGLLERQSDPADGRASLLALTPKAGTVLAEHDRIRLAHFAQLLDGWSEADLRRFAGMLQRFTSAYEATNGDWINERVATRTARTGSTN